MIDQARLQSQLHYDPDTGIFTWKVSRRGVRAGKVAGSRHEDGSIIITVDRVGYRAHRLAWLYMTGRWPKEEIDHKDLDSANNRWSNLREAKRSENASNRRMFKNNKCGFKGVYRVPSGKYRARIIARKIKIDLGHFATAEEAHQAYCVAAERVHGEFARAA